MCFCKDKEKIKRYFTWPLPIGGRLVSIELDHEYCKTHDYLDLYCDNRHNILDSIEKIDRAKGLKRLNLHAHTTWSDGGNTIEEMAIAARENNMPALVVTDHDYMLMAPQRGLKELSECVYSPWRTPEIGIARFKQQTEEARIVSDKLEYPIIVGIEANFYTHEALLFGKDAILDYFEDREQHISYKKEDRIFNVPNFRKKNYALVVCHPRTSTETHINCYKGLFNLAHGYEIVNTHTLWTIDDLARLREWCPHGRPFMNIDAHSTGYFKYYCNSIEPNVKIENENDLINWIKQPTPTIYENVYKMQRAE